MISPNLPNLSEVEKLIQQEHNLHPRAELIDYYKLYFQAICGPGHLIENEESAALFLRKELSESRINNEPLFQDISFSGFDFCRVNLKLIRLKLIKEEVFLNLFIESALSSKNRLISQKEWLEIEELIKGIQVIKTGYEKQKQSLNSQISFRQIRIPRHSKVFRITYRPHYRLIRKSLLEEWM